MYGLGTSANKLYQIAMVGRLGRARYRSLCAKNWYVVLSRGLTFTWFGVSMLWFWSDWGQLATYVRALGVPAVLSGIVLTIVTGGTVLSMILRLERPVRGFAVAGRRIFDSPYVRTALTTVIVTLTFSVTVLLRAPAARIVYKGF
jgi:hypothetical protein